MRALLLFDIDKTLIIGKYRDGWPTAAALKSVFGRELEVTLVPTDGLTDREIVWRILQANQIKDLITEDLMDQVLYNLIIEFEKRLNSYEITVLPETKESLSFLEKENFLLGLVTGNCERIAQLKLTKADLWQHFSFGGFGGHSRDRSTLVLEAIKKAKDLHGFYNPAQTFVIGDTPNDIHAGIKAGVRTIGVATGIFSKEELLQAGSERVFDHIVGVRESLRD
ncbi:MAG: HAD hydrolase-like protein [bacterium]|nr:HAD hydrolase-like protein [bacterium]